MFLLWIKASVLFKDLDLEEKMGKNSLPEVEFGETSPHPLKWKQQWVEKNSESKKPSRGLASMEDAPKGVVHSLKEGLLEHSLIVSQSAFTPKVLFLTKDIPTKIYVTSVHDDPLCVMNEEFAIRRQVKNQELLEIDLTPKEAGVFRIYCPINGIEGYFVVKDF